MPKPALIRLLDDGEHTDSDFRQSFTTEAALSHDSMQVAAGLIDWQAGEVAMTLTLFNTADGSIAATMPAGSGNGHDCVGMLDFSPDGTRLQCGGTVYDLATGKTASAYDTADILLSMYADFPPGDRAPNGAVVRPSDLPSRTAIFDADANMHFAPDSVGLLEVWRAYFNNRGQRWWTPSVFRYLSGVGVWDGQTKTLLRRFYANERYSATAWSRDATRFGFVSDDFYLTVFRR
jgi:hypothetical protein